MYAEAEKNYDDKEELERVKEEEMARMREHAMNEVSSFRHFSPHLNQCYPWGYHWPYRSSDDSARCISYKSKRSIGSVF